MWTRWRRLAIAAGLATAFTAGVDAGDSVTGLIRSQTDAFAQASDRGDQDAMGALLDDEILFSGGSGHVDRDPQKDRDDPTSALLKQQTQTFHDAGQRGHLAIVRRYLDPQLLYVDEDGVLRGQREFKTAAPAVPAGASSSKVELTDWALHYSGDVAVASYVNDQTAQVGSQVLHDQFLSVDSWIKRGNAWKLLGSETIPLNQDPPATTGLSQNLEQYVGAYSAGQALHVSIERDGTTLKLSSNAGVGSTPSSSTLITVAPDILVRAGTAPGYGRLLMVFRRDTDGKLTGYTNRDVLVSREAGQAASAATASTAPHSTLVLRDFEVHQVGDVAVATFFHDRTTDFGGQSMHATYRSMETWIKRPDGWKMIASQGRELLADAQTIALPAAQVGQYEGIYSAGAGLTVTLAGVGDALTATMRGSAPMRLLPVTRDYFIVPGRSRFAVLFRRDATDHVIGYLSRSDGRDVSFTRT